MNLIFIHHSFPGQFLGLAPFCAKNVSAKTLFLTESTDSQNIEFPGVELVELSLHRQPLVDSHDYLKGHDAAVLRGQAVVRALDKLKVNGFVPDVAIVYSGLGYGLYIKELLPQIRLIGYVEWFVNCETAKFLLGEIDFNTRLKVSTSQWPLIQELLVSDDLICPSAWQRQQFPLLWRDRIRVIFDGVNTSLFKPGKIEGEVAFSSGTECDSLMIKPSDRVLSYATRGMEPLRGFPEFMRAAVAAQRANSDVHVVIAGQDRVVYSEPSSHPTGSWKLQLLEELKDDLDFSRLHFVGLLNYGELANLFRRSDLHCYFTRPYVVSWGIYEAAASGSRLLVNQFPGLHEVLDTTNLLVPPIDIDDQDALDAAVIQGLSLPRSHNPLPSLLSPGLSRQESMYSWKALLTY